ncbi:MAG: hypothetical protein LBH06_02840 [Rikenellaceae bacterium]|nr:hypothetical protein [Rikenellaceae bacterium]
MQFDELSKEIFNQLIKIEINEQSTIKTTIDGVEKCTSTLKAGDYHLIFILNGRKRVSLVEARRQINLDSIKIIPNQTKDVRFVVCMKNTN